MFDLAIDHPGFRGDILFLGGAIEQLRREGFTGSVFLKNRFPEVDALLPPELNITTGLVIPQAHRHVVVSHHIVNVSPMIQDQVTLGVKNPIPHFRTFVEPDLVEIVHKMLGPSRESSKKLICYDVEWNKKSWKCSAEDYEKAHMYEHMGYGNAKYDIERVIRSLGELGYGMIPVGAPAGRTLEETAAIMANADVFIGPEGGLANVAYGLGVPTILSEEFVHIMYGSKGYLQQHQQHKLGPVHYLEGFKHRYIPMFLSEDEWVTYIDTELSNR